MSSIDQLHDASAPRAEAQQGNGTFQTSETPRKKQRRGFAAMDPSKQKEIASKGGRASHAHGTGHEWNSDSARAAGRKGGLAQRGGRGKQAVPNS